MRAAGLAFDNCDPLTPPLKETPETVDALVRWPWSAFTCSIMGSRRGVPKDSEEGRVSGETGEFGDAG
jgi:hypothetical protein